jgi:hypothetical protein
LAFSFILKYFPVEVRISDGVIYVFSKIASAVAWSISPSILYSSSWLIDNGIFYLPVPVGVRDDRIFNSIYSLSILSISGVFLYPTNGAFLYPTDGVFLYTTVESMG